MPLSTSNATSPSSARDKRSLRSRQRSRPSVSSVERVPKIELSEAEQVQYDSIVAQLLHQTAQEYRNYVARGSYVDLADWSQVRSNNDMTIYRSLKATVNPRVSVMLGIGKIDGSLEDVMDGLYNDTSVDLRATKALRKYKCIVGKVLHVSATRTPNDPFTFAGIKWLVSKMPALSNDRDLLTYERQGLTVDADGNDVAYHMMQSIDRPEWPANAFKNVLRSHSAVCFLFKRIGPNSVQAFLFGEHYTSGNIPHKIVDYSIAGKWLSVTKAPRCAAAKKLSQLKASVRTKANDSCSMLTDTNRCSLCEQRRGLFSPQQLCGCCQQNVCRSCSLERKLFELDASEQLVSERVCKRCIATAAKQRGSTIAWNGVPAKPAPACFNGAFETTLVRSNLNSGPVLAAPTPYARDFVIDTAYLDQSLRRLGSDSVSEVDSDSACRRRANLESVTTTSSSSGCLV